ncbi:MAG: hypothetical protein LQ337_007110 [Flavoplaca oasis]|nr:MAG: hypothetical protein LQ337_007110 [Flavoplaca oasis]
MPTYTSSAISTFITHLRLLNLDQLDDWPTITEELFASKHARESQKQRVRCVEWALYRLFELWNPKDTKNKLQPFFPPYESLRSLNLRAALFRCLNDLKKEGFLGKEIVIRKTMFDDCRGDKFGELISSFSTIVLQKTLRSQPDSTTSITGRLATRRNIPRREQRSLLPLAIAHQGALKALLERKKRLKDRYANLQKVLDSKEQELLKRVDDLALADTKHPLEAVSDRAVQEIRQQFDENWQGNRIWIKSIIEADSQDVADPLLDTPFANVWAHVEQGTIDQVGEDLQKSLVQGLTKRVRVQQDRLSQWQSIRQALIHSRPKSPSKVKGKTTPYHHRALQSPLKFSYAEQHHGNGDIVNGPISPEMKMQRRQLLDYSHRKTKSLSSPSRKLEFRQPRREWVDPNIVEPGEPNLSGQLESNASAVVTPTRGSFSVVEQLDKPPQDASLRRYVNGIEPPIAIHTASDLRLTHRSSDPDEVGNETAEPRAQGQQPIEQHQESPRPLQNEQGLSLGCPSSTANRVQTPNTGLEIQEDVLAQQLIVAAINSEASPVKHKISLMERTRQSMAFSQKDTLLPDPTVDLPPPPELATQEPNGKQSTTLNRSSSLVERTRRSMSLLPASFHSNSSHPSHNRRQPRQYPTNQFETPKKQLEDLKETTPPDVLFSPEADYASVFKSRPKIATSPSLSPTLAKRMEWDEGGEKDDVGSG